MLWHVIWTNEDPDTFEGVIVTEIIQGKCLRFYADEDSVAGVFSGFVDWFRRLGAEARGEKCF